MSKLCILFVLLVMFNSCKKEAADYTQIDEDIITQYITDNNLTAIANKIIPNTFFKTATPPSPRALSIFEVIFKTI